MRTVAVKKTCVASQLSLDPVKRYSLAGSTTRTLENVNSSPMADVVETETTLKPNEIVNYDVNVRKYNYFKPENKDIVHRL